MSLTAQDAERLARDGIAALQQRRAVDARAAFERVVAAGYANPQLWLLLATACRDDGDMAASEVALDRLLAADPRVVRAHIMKGDCRAHVGDDDAALDFYVSAQRIAGDQRVPDELAAELRRAATAAAGLKSRAEDRLETALGAAGFPAGDRSDRFQQSLDLRAGRKQLYLQEPTGYYFPGLPQIQFYDTARFAWVPAIEAATGAIRDELRALLAGGLDGFRPYIRRDPNAPRLDDNPLLDNRDWSALFLCENGVVVDDMVARCPATWAAVQGAPLPRIRNSPTVMFSLLRPGARINPHTGTHNTRLTCHLPLIVPPGCTYRVGNDVRQWEEGKLLIFDDTIEHEASNQGTEDRIVLIFDIWQPDLSERERAEVGAIFDAAGSTREAG